jgi:CRP-like cAMP-binding protein
VSHGGERRELPFESLPLFAGMTPAHREPLARVLEVRALEAGEALLTEGTPTEHLYVLARGRARVERRDAHAEEVHEVAEVGAGAVLGEMSIFDGLPTTASVIALERCAVWQIPFTALRPGGALVAPSAPHAAELAEAYEDLVCSMARVMAARLREQSTADLLRARERAAMGLFVVDVLVLLAGYAVLLAGLPRVKGSLPGSTSYLSLPLIGLFAYGGVRFIRRTGLPIASFGLGLKNSLGSLGLALLATPPLLAAITGVKLVALHVNDAWRGMPLFEHTDVAARFRDPAIQRLVLVYAVSSFVQELIVRCALQSGLMLFLRGKSATMRAVLVAALLFAVTHLHMSFFFALFAFGPGVVWGLLYAKRPHVLGVTLSHVVTGSYVFFVLGTNLP